MNFFLQVMGEVKQDLVSGQLQYKNTNPISGFCEFFLREISCFVYIICDQMFVVRIFFINFNILFIRI